MRGWMRTVDGLPKPGSVCLMLERLPERRPVMYLAKFVSKDFGFSILGKQECVDTHPCLWWADVPELPDEALPCELADGGQPSPYLVTETDGCEAKILRFPCNAEAMEYARLRGDCGAKTAVYVPIADYGYDKQPQ